MNDHEMIDGLWACIIAVTWMVLVIATLRATTSSRGEKA